MSKKRKREVMASITAWKDALRPKLMNLELMKNRCTTSVTSNLDMIAKSPNGRVIEGKDGKFGFLDRGGSILAVCHLDSTGHAPHFGHVEIGDDTWVFTRWVDDRLGFFLLLDVLAPYLDYDILLCTGEESGKSTSFHFELPEGKHYRWMFELDRMGDDAVHYQYTETAWLAALRSSGFTKLSRGSYTDIVDLEHLNICGVNIAIGYEDNHSTWAKANLSVTLEQVARFCEFYTSNSEIDYPYKPAERVVVYPKVDAPETGKATGASSGRSGRSRRTGAAVSDSWYGRGGSSVWPPVGASPKPHLTMLEVVRANKSGEYWQIGGEPYYTASGWRVKLDRPVGDDRPGIVSVYVEVDTFDRLRYNDEAEAALKIFPKGLYPTDLRERTITTVNANNSEAYQKLLTAADGNCWEEPTMKARESFERSYFDKGEIEFHSTRNVDLTGRTTRPVQTDRFPHYKQAVYTPYGKGEIDSYYPVETASQGEWWWVRFEKPDTVGHVCALVDEAEITPNNIVAVTAPAQD